MKKSFLYTLVLVVIALGLTKCNKAVNNLLNDSNQQAATDTAFGKHVLYIILDGTRGSVVRSLNPTNIRNYTYASTCTFYSLDNASKYPEVSLVDMLTGVDSTKHKVVSSDLSKNNFANYSTLSTRLQNSNARFTSYAYLRNSNVNKYAFNDAKEHVNFSSDVDVKNMTIKCLQNNDPSLLVAEFSSIDSVGAKNGYQLTTAPYTNQITKLDGYIGECVNAIQSRPNFAQEDWLVVIASNQGGALSTDPDYGKLLYDNPISNGFVIFYNPKFALMAYAKPAAVAYSGSTPIYTNVTYYAQLTNTSLYNISATSEMTIQFKMKIIALANNTYNPGILKKTASSANSNQGWWFIHSNNTGAIRFVLKGATGSAYTLVSNVAAVGEWHTFTGKVYIATNKKRYMKLYMDGISKGDSLDVTGIDCTTTTAMDLGQRGSFVSGTTSEMVTDLQIFGSPLPDDVIAKYACIPGIDKSHPYYNNLTGYWSCNSTGQSYIEDLTGNGRNFIFTGSTGTNWNAYSDVSNAVCVPVTNEYLKQNPRGLDIPYQIYSWFGISTLSSWGLDGKAWSYTYTTTSK